MSSSESGSPAGRPSRMATRARPWAPPAVRNRSIVPSLYGSPDRPSEAARRICRTCDCAPPLACSTRSAASDPRCCSRPSCCGSSSSTPRRPFILVASPLLAICFVLLWRPPDARISTANALYLAVTLGVFFFLYTMVLNPYTALLPEVTAGGRGRVATTSLQAAFNLAGLGAAFVGSSWLSTRFGFSTMGLILAPIGLAALLTSTTAVRERIPTAPPQPIRATVRSVFNDPRFRVFIPAIATVWFGLSMVQLSLALIVTVLMGLPQSAIALFLGLTLGTTVVSLPFAARLIRRRVARPRSCPG